ncbi:MAG: M43 family zinc metalloprotease [Candidatus Eisenbacteria bacterium]
MKTLRFLFILIALTVPGTRVSGAASAGPIMVDGRVFASWTDFFLSDYFRENGKRCGTPDPLAPRGTPGFLGGPGDCSLGLTNPLPEYEPDVSCEITVVIHRLESATGDGVYPDSMVRTQIDVLNEDFQAVPGTNGYAGYNSRVRFRLATRDPAGNPSPGWTQTTNEFWFNDLPDPTLGTYYDNLAWDPHRYLNIYTLSPVAPGGLVLGYVPFFPQDGGVGTNEDGVRCLWNAFGRTSPNAPYDLGRTVTHEVGHYVGLYHTFQGSCGTATAPGCYSTGDRVCDTDPEAASQGGCPTESSCSAGYLDPVHNYMDYTNDACMNQFTHEQVRRLICTIRHYRPLICPEDQPTATLLQRFAAVTLREGEVELAWSARMDDDIVGWNLYRGVASGVEVRVNREPIPLTGGGEFLYIDSPGPIGTVNYRLAGMGADGAERSFGSTSVEMGAQVRAFSATILGSNPARGPIRLAYALPQRAHVRVEAFSVTGQRVRTLVDDDREAGTHIESFTIRAGGGRPLGPGVYLIRITAGGESRSLRVVAID